MVVLWQLFRRVLLCRWMVLHPVLSDAYGKVRGSSNFFLPGSALGVLVVGNAEVNCVCIVVEVCVGVSIIRVVARVLFRMSMLRAAVY